MRVLTIGYESALAFWRSVRLAQEPVCERSEDVVYGRGETSTARLARRAAELCGLDLPIHIVVSSQAERPHAEDLVAHLSGAPLEAAHVFSIDRELAVCRIPAVLVQLGSTLDEIDLARIAYEMTGAYGLDGEGEAVSDLRPLVSLGELRSYATAARACGARGAARVIRALDLVVPGSNSPRETDVALVLKLPRSRGGIAFPGFTLNERVRLPERAQRIASIRELRPDFHWAKWLLAMEYESDRYHLSPEAMKRDERRRRALEAAGYTVKRLTNDILMSDTQFNIFMTELVQVADPYRRPASDKMLARRAALRERLFGTQSEEEAQRDLSTPYQGVIV